METAKRLPAFMERGLAKQNYSFFVEYVHDGAYKHGKHTRFISEKLQEIEKKHAAGIPTYTIFTMPPRHSKSMTITETFPTWFMGRDKKRRVIEVSYGQDLARKFGLANLQKIEGKAGEIFDMQLDSRQSAATNFNLKGHPGGMLSTGIGGGITGQGADLLIIDDPIKNRQQANSPAYREMIWNEWSATLQTRLQPTGSVIVILTRWHEDDLAGRLIDSDSRDWEVISMPLLAGENDPIGREPGQPLWPEYGFNEEWAKRTEKAVGPLDWASLFQQEPRPQEGTLLKRHYWKYYDKPQDPRSFDLVIQSWDCTFKDLDTSDFVAGTVWGKRGPDVYLLDVVHEKLGITATMSAIENMSGRWPQAHAKYIEDKANGPAVIELLRQKLPGIMPVNPKGGKIDRAQAALPFIAAGNVYLPTPDMAPWVNDLVNEAASFPYGKHDDLVDSTTQALLQLFDEPQIFIGRA